MLLEIGKERGPIHAVERRLRPVEHFLQPERLKLRRRGELLEEGPVSSARAATMPLRAS